MVCPLRYVVAAVSLVVMLAALTWGNSSTSVVSGSGDRDKTKRGKPQSWAQWVLDLFTGRYLYEAWATSRARSAAEVVPAATAD